MSFKQSLRHDFSASIVVFLVALPLCLGIAIATGFPPAAGLISGIIGGIVVGALAGCPLQVSGPAAGLITILWEAVEQFGIETVGLIILLAGLMQVGMGILGLGLWFRAVSPAVIRGMLAGIGILIFSSQFHVMVDDKPRASGIENFLSIPESFIKGVIPMVDSVHHIAAAIGLVTIVCIALWKLSPQRLKWVPAPLFAVITGTVLANVMQLPINYVQVPDSLAGSLHLFDWSLLSRMGEGPVLITALSIAFIASAETLLTATAVDQMSPKCTTNYNREIIAQGVGNAMAGLLGVLPITGVIVRSSANVQAGAETRQSAILHGIWILMFVLLMPFVLELIPVAALAAILVYTGYKLVNIQAARQLLQFGRSELIIYIVTVVGIVATNLLEGVLLGLGLAMLKQFYIHSRLHIEQVTDAETQDIHVLLTGTASFVTLPVLAARLEQLPPGRKVHIHIHNLNAIDHACIELLQGWETRYAAKDGAVVLEWEAVMSKYALMNQKPIAPNPITVPVAATQTQTDAVSQQ
ncbi:MAG: SulP family inorganic anion transporter [Candidatus Melainabacteria bacterium]